MKTLQEFVKECGSQKLASQKIGITEATLNRTIKGHTRPSLLLVHRLKQLGVVFVPVKPA